MKFWNGSFSNVLSRLEEDCPRYVSDLCQVLEAGGFVKIRPETGKACSPTIYQKEQIQVVLVYNYAGFAASALVVEVHITCVRLVDIDETKLLLEGVKPEKRPIETVPARKPSLLFRLFGI